MFSYHQELIYSKLKKSRIFVCYGDLLTDIYYRAITRRENEAKIKIETKTGNKLVCVQQTKSMKRKCN